MQKLSHQVRECGPNFIIFAIFGPHSQHYHHRNGAFRKIMARGRSRCRPRGDSAECAWETARNPSADRIFGKPRGRTGSKSEWNGSSAAWAARCTAGKTLSAGWMAQKELSLFSFTVVGSCKQGYIPYHLRGKGLWYKSDTVLLFWMNTSDRMHQVMHGPCSRMI